LASKFAVYFPVDVKGVLENASAIRTAILAALLSIDWVMSGACRSDDTSRLLPVWHVNANLGIAIS
jgi:hypothetical protein